MDVFLLIIMVVVLIKLFAPAKLELPEGIVCAGIIAICVLTYLVSLIPIALWPIIIWIRNYYL